MKAKWLFDEHPILVDKELASVIGLNESIVLQQLNYWLHSKSAKQIDGRLWIYNTYSNWRKDNFPFWSERTIRRAFDSCEKKGLVITGNFNKAGFDKTKWYSIDTKKLDDLMSSACGQNGQTNRTKSPDGSGQNRQTNTRDYPETTPENNKHSASHSNAQSVSQLEKEFEEVWTKYPNKKGKKQAFNHYKAWRRKSTKHTNEYLLERLKVYMTDLQQNSWKHPMNGSTWFNGRFDDELEVDNPKPANKYEQEGYYDDYKDFVRDDGKGDNLLDGVSDDELPF
ncbi:conserved phage C-terminal domain-containing protein [Limosilactobacillus reuteri]|uniref:conserved phage C-terminal domain-containing protein n=1 Tax=Limosilactobacillus reuteri TaxID=1598 RepID=UPI003FD32B92